MTRTPAQPPGTDLDITPGEFSALLHDLNNALGKVLGGLDVLMAELHSAEMRAMAQHAINAAIAAVALSQRLKSSRRGTAQAPFVPEWNRFGVAFSEGANNVTNQTLSPGLTEQVSEKLTDDQAHGDPPENFTRIVHDLNNSLSTIMGSLDLLGLLLTEETARKLTEDAMQATKEASNLARLLRQMQA